MMTPVVEVLLLTRRRPAGMAPSPKRRFPRPRRSGENPQVAAIDQPVLDQGLEQIGAAVHLELGAVLLLEAPDLRDDVALFPSSPNEQWEGHADGQEDPLWPAGARRSQASGARRRSCVDASGTARGLDDDAWCCVHASPRPSGARGRSLALAASAPRQGGKGRSQPLFRSSGHYR